MKIIFLNIDGVLATEGDSWIPPHELYAYPFNPTCVRVFNEILKTTNAEIVLSSDWRLMYNQDLEMLGDLFKYNGVIRKPIDVTPKFGKHGVSGTKDYIKQFIINRENEIEYYINKFKNKISKYVILDDADLKIYPDNFIKCNVNEGLKQLGLKEKIISIL